MARAGAALFAAEGGLVVAATLARNQLGRGILDLLVAAGGLGLGALVLFGYRRLGRAGTHLVALVGSALVSLLVYAEPAIFGVLFVWLVFFVTFFFPRRQAALHVSWMIAGLAAALFASRTAREAGQAWILLAGVLAGTYGLVLVLRGELAKLVRERTLALEREREGKALLDVLFASAPVGIAQFDRDLRYLRVNETLAAANGLVPGDQVGRTFRDVLPHLADRFEPIMLGILETGEPVVGIETATPSVDEPGRVRYHRSARYPLRSEDGEIVGVGVIVDDVTELREAQAELEQALAQEAETRALLDAVLANAPAVIGLLDRNLRFVHANQAAADLNGASPGGLVGRTFAEAFPELADEVVPRLEAVLATGEPVVGEEVTRLSSRTGELRHWLVNRYPIRDGSGEIVGVATIMTDVTELRRTRDALEQALTRERQASAVLDALFADAPVGVVLFDRDLRYVRVNATYASWTGATPEEHVGLRIDDLHPGIGAQVEPVMREILRSGRPVVGFEAQRDDGRTFRSSRYPIRDDDGEVIGIATIVDDVTDLKRAERRLQAALAAEHESRLFLDHLLDHAPLSFTLVDRELRYTLVNRVAAEVTGLAPGDMLGRTVEEIHPALAPVVVPAIRSVFETGMPIVGQEVEDHDPTSGAPRHWLVSRFPVLRNDEIVGVTSIRTEVTSLKQLEEQLEQMLALESSARVEVEEARSELAQIASTDALTGLANRRRFSEHLELALARSRRTGSVVAILYLDLDGFKAVNDTLGHEEGDRLLCDVAAVLRENARETDLVARLGGDEFLVLLDDLDAPEAERVAAAVADRLAAQIARIGPGVTTSIGFAFAPRDGLAERELLAAADAEMYRHKRTRRHAA